MNPKIHALAHVVADLVAIKHEEASLKQRKGALVAALRSVVGPADVAAFREEYGAVLNLAVHADPLPAIPIAEFQGICHELSCWPDHGHVDRNIAPDQARQILNMAWPHAVLRVDIAPLVLRGNVFHGHQILAEPPSAVAALLEAGGHPAARDRKAPRLEFKMKPGITTGEGEAS